MFSFFSPFPYVRLLIYWVLGTLLARFCPQWAWVPLATFGLCLSLIQTEFLFALAFITLSIFRFDQVQIPYSLASDSAMRACVVEVVEPPIEKAKTWLVVGRALALRDQGTWHSASGFWRVYFEKSARPPQRGAKYLVIGYLNPMASPTFPSGMDWSAYFAQKGVGGQIYVKNDQWEQFGSIEYSWDWLTRSQKYFQTAIQRALPVGVDRDVAEAMFLGVASTIDFETMQRYASLGAIHILSVSGLHVGFLYLGLAFIFGFLRRWPWIHFLMIMLFLWAYAGLTGFSGPVLRSAWMFSVILGAKSFRQNHHPVNTLAFSCLVLLAWDPQFIFQAGFQLSYAAVLGLILFQSKLKNCYTSKYWLINQIWEVTCVAIAAQILTWPLVLYYFHQFPHPLYFFLLNPLLILLSSITLAVGFIFLALSPFNFSWFGYLLSICFQCFHGLLFFVADYFHPVIALLQLSFWEVIAYFFLVSLLAIWWHRRANGALVLMGAVILCLTFQRISWVPKDELFVTVHENRAIAVQVAGAHAVLYGQIAPSWMQSNIIPLLASSHVQDTISRNLPRAWKYAERSFFVARKPCVPSSQTVTDLIIEPDQVNRDLRWLRFWPMSHWYFVRRPSIYRLSQIRGLPSHGVTFLSEVPAVNFKKKAALVRQPELN